MRGRGDNGYYIEDRDRELMAAFSRCYTNAPSGSSFDEIVDCAIHSQSSRYFVTDERAMVVIPQILGGNHVPDKYNPVKNEMYIDIANKVARLMRSGVSMRNAIKQIIRRPAPRFYLTHKSAVRLIYAIKRKCRTRIIK